MIYCPKCSNELADSAKFCNKCGSKIEAQNANTPAAAQQTAEAFTAPAAENNGYNPVPDPYAADPNAKKNTKKFILIGGVVVGVAAIAAIAIALIAGGGKKESKSNAALYIRDDQLVYHNLKGDPIELSDDLYDDYDLDAEDAAYYAGDATYISGKSNLVIFPDDMAYDYYDYEYTNTLYYVKGVGKDMEPEKLANNVDCYFVTEDEKTVFYLTSDGDLYQSNFAEKDKIDSDVDAFYANENGSKLIYMNDEGTLYLWTKESGEEEKIDSDVSYIEDYSEDLSKIFYVQEDRLYMYDTKAGEEVKIASDVDNVLRTYDSGEAYYLVAEERPISDLIEDDMADADADIMDPDDLENPAYDLEYPDSSDYDDYDEYWDAYDAYWDEYYELDDAYWEEYYELYDLYDEKQDRDWLREDIADDTYTIYSLYYFDGTEDVLVSESFDYDDYTTAQDSAVVAFTATSAEIEKIKLSELDYYSYYAETVADMAMGGSQTLQVAVKGTATEVEVQEEDFSIEGLSKDGKTLLILDNAEYEMEEGYEDYEGTEYEEYYQIFKSAELFKVTIGDTPGAPESVATDVYTASLSQDGKIAYFTDYDSEEYCGTLFIDGTEVGEVMLYTSEYHEETGKMLFFSDWDEEDACGTLMMYKDGKVTEIKDEVHEAIFTANGDILYLYDYSTSREKGDLYKYTGKDEDQKLDEDVQALISTMTVSDNYKG